MFKYVLFFLLLTTTSFAQEKVLERWEKDGTTVSFALFDTATGKKIRGHNSNVPLIPASTFKVITALYALENLGPTKTLQTSVHGEYPIVKGVLKGNLYLKGEGDPTFTSRELYNLALDLKAKGLKKVEGKLIYDDSHFQNHIRISKIGNHHEPHNPGVSALSMNFNRIDIFQFNKVSQAVSPLKAIILKKRSSLENQLKFKSISKDHWLYSTKKKLRKVETLPIQDPSIQTAKLFHYYLKILNIDISNLEKGILPKKTIKITFNNSVPILELVESNLEYSNNLIAESLLLNTSKKITSKRQNINQSSLELKKWLLLHYPKSSFDKSSIRNGSGLTTKTKITSSSLAKIIASKSLTKYSGRYFFSLFPEAGKKSWIKQNRFHNPLFFGRLWIKTGSLDYVNNLAGHFISKSGKVITFALFANHLKNRKELDKGPGGNFNQLTSSSRKWKRKIQSLQNKLIKTWIESI